MQLYMQMSGCDGGVIATARSQKEKRREERRRRKEVRFSISLSILYTLAMIDSPKWRRSLTYFHCYRTVLTDRAGSVREKSNPSDLNIHKFWVQQFCYTTVYTFVHKKIPTINNRSHLKR
jgi:hypothetical protein